jgi:hypothetical protein
MVETVRSRAVANQEVALVMAEIFRHRVMLEAVQRRASLGRTTGVRLTPTEAAAVSQGLSYLLSLLKQRLPDVD